MKQASREQRAVGELALGLRGSREEIEAATLTRVFAVSALPSTGGPEYAEGLRRAIAAAIEYGLTSIERFGSLNPTPPAVLLGQASLAARSGVGLDTVLRRYLAGHAILADFVVQEAEGRLPPSELKRILRRLAVAVDRLIVGVSGAYLEESEKKRGPAERRHAELIERLLSGEPIDTTELGYDLGGWHLGLVASGQGTVQALASLGRSLNARLLVLPRESDVCWAWLGSRQPLNPGDAWREVEAVLATGDAAALGEPGEGERGWRLTHRQAAAALPVAVRGRASIVSYRDVALLAAGLQDELLGASLRQLYIDPLKHERDGGTLLFRALRAYFASDRNVSSAAAALGVTRKTVNSRLRLVEQLLGRPLGACDSDLRVALQLNGCLHVTPGPKVLA